MFLRGSQARFTDPDSGKIVHVGSLPHSIGAFVMAAVRAGFELEGIGEHAPDGALVEAFPRAEQYQGYPMLVILTMVRALIVSAEERRGQPVPKR